jgi:hypothetical protein
MNYLHCHSDSKSEIVYYPGGKVEITFICIAEAFKQDGIQVTSHMKQIQNGRKVNEITIFKIRYQETKNNVP